MSPIISTAKFLDVVVPEGNRYIGFTDGQALPSGREIIKCSSFEKGLQGVTRADGVARRVDAPNLYFALASFKEKQVWDEKFQRMKSYRKQENVDRLRALWLDIDFKMYGSPKECVQDIERFLVDFPAPTFMVNSGGGIHLYWVFEEDLTVTQWMPLAMGLAAIAKTKKLRADYGVTIDPARVLRLPGYANPKYDHKPVCEVKMMGNYASLGRMDELLRPHAAAVTSSGIAVDSNVIAMFDPVTHNEDLSGGYTSNRRSFFAAIAQECGVVKDSLERQGNGDSYQLWKDLLHLAAFTEDGDQFAQEISKGDPRYDQANVEEFYAQSVALRTSGTRGPTTCPRFSQSSDKCSVCPHAGKINTPWMLGVPLEDKQTRDASFVRNGKTYTTEMIKEAEGGAEIQEIMIADAELDNWRLLASIDDNVPNEMLLDIKNGKTTRTVRLDGKILADTKRFREVFFNGGYPLDQTQAGKVIKVATKWAAELNRRREANKYTAAGWTDNGKAFVLGEVAYTRDSQEPVINGKASSELGTAGKPEPWLKMAQKLLDSDDPAMGYLLCAGMAAPLMGILSVHTSMAISAFSRNTGAGKTVALRTVRGAFGHPDSGNSLEDTEASVVIKMGGEQGLPAVYDEIRGEGAGERLVKILFQLTQQKTKARANPDATLKDRQRINTMMLCGTNVPVADYVSERVNFSNAGFARFIEIELQQKENDNELTAMNTALNQNYGHFGPVLVQTIMQMEKQLPVYEEAIIKSLQRRRQWSNEERFWLWGTTKILLAAAIMDRTGLLKIDGNKIRDYALHAVDTQKQEMEEHVSNDDDMLSGIFKMFSNEVLITDDFKDGQGGNRALQIHRHPARQDVNVHVSANEKAMRITLSAVRAFAKEKGAPYNVTSQMLTGRFNGSKKKSTFAAGTPYSGGGVERYLELDMTKLQDPDALISFYVSSANGTASTSSQPATPGSSSDGQP